MGSIIVYSVNYKSDSLQKHFFHCLVNVKHDMYLVFVVVSLLEHVFALGIPSRGTHQHSSSAQVIFCSILLHWLCA